jgi:hypothetical protein
VNRNKVPNAHVIPVALFTYNRPRHLAETLACLQANRVPLLYVFSDGPKVDDAQRVAEVRKIVRRIDWCDVSVIERPVNLGLGVSIRSGVSHVLDRHESVLVFEDDLVCVKGTYAYLSAALAHYRDEPSVMSVTGWTHPDVAPAGLNGQPYFDGRGESWSWGTWRRAWQSIDRADALTLLRECERRGIDPYRCGADLVEMAHAEHVRNLWAVRFLYRHILEGGLCLRPPHSLVEHIGGDAEGTNHRTDAWKNPPLQECPRVPVSWPSPDEHPDCPRLSAAAFGSRPPKPSSLRRLARRCRRALPSRVSRALQGLWTS